MAVARVGVPRSQREVVVQLLGALKMVATCDELRLTLADSLHEWQPTGSVLSFSSSEPGASVVVDFFRVVDPFLRLDAPGQLSFPDLLTTLHYLVASS